MPVGRKPSKPLVPISHKNDYNGAMPVSFLKEKEYVVISSRNRVPYYINLQKSFSLSMKIMTLEEMKALFLLPHPETHFVNKEILISGYYTKGDVIAHYLNSLSHNMAIGYELEPRREDPISETVYENNKEELSSIMEKAKEIHQKSPAKPIYFLNLAPKEKRIVKENAPFVNILCGYVLPLDGLSFFLHWSREKYFTKEDKADRKMALTSPFLVSLSSSKRYKF